MRHNGYRINLRGLAEVQTLGWIFLTVLALWLFCLFCSWVSQLTSEDGIGHNSMQQLKVQKAYMSSQPSRHSYNAKHPNTYSSQYAHDAL